jgi:hypothetical protein
MKIRYAALFSLLLLCFCSRAQYQQDWLVFPSVGNGERLFFVDELIEENEDYYSYMMSYSMFVDTSILTEFHTYITKRNSTGKEIWRSYLPTYKNISSPSNKTLYKHNNHLFALGVMQDSIYLHSIDSLGTTNIVFSSEVIYQDGANLDICLLEGFDNHIYICFSPYDNVNTSVVFKLERSGSFIEKIHIPHLPFYPDGLLGADKYGSVYYTYRVYSNTLPDTGDIRIAKLDVSGNTTWDSIFGQTSSAFMIFLIDSSGNIFSADSSYITKYDSDRNTLWSYSTNGFHLVKAYINDGGEFFGLLSDLYGTIYKLLRLTNTGLEVYNKPLNYPFDLNNYFFIVSPQNNVYINHIKHGSPLPYIWPSTYHEVLISRYDTLGETEFIFRDTLQCYSSSATGKYSTSSIDSKGNILFSMIFSNPNLSNVPQTDSILLHKKVDLWYTTKYCTSCRHNIVGDVRLDTLSNCIADSAEPAIDKMLLRLNPNEKYAFSNLQGKYRFAESDSGTHTVTILPPDYFITPCDTQKTFTLNDTIGTASPDFVLQINPDCIGQLTTTGTRARYGFTQQVNLRYRNTGYPPQSGFVSLQPHSNFSYVGANPPADSVSGNTYFWHFSNLQLFETMQVNVSLHVNLFINNAFSHIATANTGCVTGMVSATDTLHDVVFGSYDPNDAIA